MPQLANVFNLKFQKICKHNFLLLFFIACFWDISAQTVNLSVEAEGDHVAQFKSIKGDVTGLGFVGLDLIRGTNADAGDWRILNDNGNFRLQYATNNYLDVFIYFQWLF